MKRLIFLLLLLLVIGLSCRKDSRNTAIYRSTKTGDSLTLAQVQAWYGNDNSATLQTLGSAQTFNVHRLRIDWSKASNITTLTNNWWVIALPGQPTFQGVKQGYRKLAFVRDSTGALQARILEIIPDAAYLRIHQGAATRTFTGRVFLFDQNYRLISGQVYLNGKQAGLIRPGAATAAGSPKLQTDEVAIGQSCDWYDANYIDSEGELDIYQEYDCTYTVYDDGSDYSPASVASGDPLGGGGGGGSVDTAPAIADLPGQSNSAIDPKAYMNCFGSLPDAGATETITVYVQEPQPGLPFNVGTNSVGHTAISLTKSVSGQTITQTVGFYPTDTKLAATGSPAKVVDNTHLTYSVSITYNVLPFEFNAVANFISNPSSTYNLYTYNCTSFVYYACQAGNINLPNPNGNVGLLQTGMTPGALGSSIRTVAPDMNVNTNGGVTGISHGPCN